MPEHTEHTQQGEQTRPGEEAKKNKIDYAALAKRSVDEGATPTVPSTLYFTYLRTDGDSFVGPASSAEQYLRKGYTISGEQTIDDIVAFNEKNAAKSGPMRTTSSDPTASPTTTTGGPHHAPEHEAPKASKPAT